MGVPEGMRGHRSFERDCTFKRCRLATEDDAKDTPPTSRIGKTKGAIRSRHTFIADCKQSQAAATTSVTTAQLSNAAASAGHTCVTT